jgi:hypothetical protein
VHWQIIEEHDLDAALDFALNWQKPAPKELWCGGQLIMRWE